MANLNFSSATPLLTTKLVGFDSPVAYGERTYTVGDLLELLIANLDAFSRNAQANSSGNSTLTIPAASRFHTEVITVSGTGRTSEIVIPVANRVDGDVVTIRLANTVNGVTLNIRNATSGGTVIYSCVSTDGNATFQVYFDGSAFQPLSNAQPVA